MNKIINEDFEILGYAQFYLYLGFTDNTATISSISFDFNKNITKEVLRNVVDINANYYKETLNKTLKEFKFVSKEAFESFYEKSECAINISWDEDNIYINGDKLRRED